MGGVWELMFDLKEGRASSSSLEGKASKRRRVEERKTGERVREFGFPLF